jgi:hypothetical protein
MFQKSSIMFQYLLMEKKQGRCVKTSEYVPLVSDSATPHLDSCLLHAFFYPR